MSARTTPTAPRSCCGPARKDIEPETLIARVAEEHQADFRDFQVAFDNYHSTHSDENRYFANTIYERNRDGGHIAKRTITQAYDPVEQMFLPDRFIKGTCPKCGAEDQYGDNCEVCGASYSPAELIEPGLGGLRGGAGAAGIRPLFLQAGGFRSRC